MHVQTCCKRKPVTRCDPSPFQNLPFGGFALPAPPGCRLILPVALWSFKNRPMQRWLRLRRLPISLPLTPSSDQASIFPFSKSESYLRDMSIINTPTCLNNVQRTPGIPPNTRNTTCIDMFEKLIFMQTNWLVWLYCRWFAKKIRPLSGYRFGAVN